MDIVTDMYWAVCPKCGCKMLKIQRGVVETICTNADCKAKWRITVEGDSFQYDYLGGILSKNSA